MIVSLVRRIVFTPLLESCHYPISTIELLFRHLRRPNPFTGAGLDCCTVVLMKGWDFDVFVLQQILMILTVDLRKMNEWLQQIRAEGLRIVYVTMGNVAKKGIH